MKSKMTEALNINWLPPLGATGDLAGPRVKIRFGVQYLQRIHPMTMLQGALQSLLRMQPPPAFRRRALPVPGRNHRCVARSGAALCPAPPAPPAACCPP